MWYGVGIELSVKQRKKKKIPCRPLLRKLCLLWIDKARAKDKYCLLCIKKARAKDKTYIWMSVLWKIKAIFNMWLPVVYFQQYKKRAKSFFFRRRTFFFLKTLSVRRMKIQAALVAAIGFCGICMLVVPTRRTVLIDRFPEAVLYNSTTKCPPPLNSGSLALSHWTLALQTRYLFCLCADW
jgi:hypothetical protein